MPAYSTLAHEPPVSAHLSTLHANENMVATEATPQIIGNGPVLEHEQEQFNSNPWWKGQEDVVISGISCRLPESDNMEELMQNLLNGVDMITEDERRWKTDFYGIPTRSGKVKNPQHFDAGFFGVHAKQCNTMDPQLRLLLEVAYEAICDAGLTTKDLKGSQTGVFVGCSYSETADAQSHDPDTVVGYTLTGCTRSMFANRVSYAFDLKGPSYAVDTACSSSLLALQQALQAIREGQCDAAIVAGTHMTLNPITSLQFHKMGMLSPTGRCQSFDANGDGYVRSEGIVAILLQRQSVALRSYCTVLHAGTGTDGNKEQGITYPSGYEQGRLLKRVYAEAGIDPRDVVYVEAHGTGTKVGDPQEVNSIAEIFCGKGREDPLLIGSVKSNLGHNEPASGLSALAKILVAMETKTIPANLHFRDPNPNIPGLNDGRLQVVAKTTKWAGGIVGINSFGFGGSNVHVILKSTESKPAKALEETEAPRLAIYASRTKAGVEEGLKFATENAKNPHALSLLNAQANLPPNQMPFRGFTVLTKKDSESSTPLEIHAISGDQAERPVWFVYSGMGTQWPGMGSDLLKFEVSRKSLDRCASILQPYGIKLLELLTSTTNEDVVNKPLLAFVSIVSVQIALTNLLASVGIVAEGLLGHSVGELGCAYADGSMTTEEAVLCAYWRGKTIQDAILPPGAMAAVGLTWEEAARRCAAVGGGVVPACHNSVDSVTVSGPAESVRKLVQQLTDEGVFAKEVKSGGVAFHSDAMKTISGRLKGSLEKVLKTPKLRSSRWISSSIREQDWENQLATYSSAAYHANNFASPVLFREALQKVPNGAVVIEIAPHCLLQAILKRSLPSACTPVGLLKAKHANNAEFLLANIGKIYQAGVAVNIDKLYPKVPFPVPPGTPMIGPIIRWDHSVDWPVAQAKEFVTGSGTGKEGSVTYTVDPFNPETKEDFLLDHVIDGRVLYPFTGYVVLAWKALCKVRGLQQEKTAVLLEDVKVFRATILSKPITFDVNVSPSNGNFEIVESDSFAASGRIQLLEDSQPFFYENLPKKHSVRQSNSSDEKEQLTAVEVYRELLLNGYEYGPQFRLINSALNDGTIVEVKWTDNWITFIDNLLQTTIVRERQDGSLRLPVRIRQLRIDPHRHSQLLTDNSGKPNLLPVYHNAATNGLIAGGVEICELVVQSAPRRLQSNNKLFIEKVHFVPYENDSALQDYPNLDQELTNLANEVRSKVSVNATKDGGVRPEAVKLLKQWVEQTSSVQLEKLLKPLLDLVVENTIAPGHLFRIAEITPQKSLQFSKTVKALLETQPLLQADMKIISPEIVQYSDEDLAAASIETVQADFGSLPDAVKGQHDLVILDRVCETKSDPAQFLKEVSALLKDNGFLIVNEFVRHKELVATPSSKDHSDWLKTFQAAGLTLIGYQAADCLPGTRYLLRKPQASAPEAKIVDIDDVSSFDWVKQLQDAIASATEGPMADKPCRVWNTSIKTKGNGSVGLSLCLRAENSKNIIRSVMDASLRNRKDSVDLNSSLGLMEYIQAKDLVRKDMVTNVLRDGAWGTFRHLPVSEGEKLVYTQTEHAFLNTLVRGDLSSLAWLESVTQFHDQLLASAQKQDTVQQLTSVYFTALNFRDVMLATGRLAVDAIPGEFADRDCLLGMEFAGRVNSSGDRVMGLLPAQALATTVLSDSRFAWAVPSSWTLEQAATVPVVYATAYYALIVRGRIRQGDRVLIHAGSGGVGQAAIAIALAEGCEVFTTVSSEAKKRFLMDRFPDKLTDRNFSNSRTTTFEFDIMEATNGAGVDVVLNSLSEDKLQASVRCLAKHGRFLEIGKFDLSNNTGLGMSIFLKNVSFHGILLDSLFDQGNRDWPEVAKLLTAGIASGVVQPLPASVFEFDQPEEAFRFMAQGKHMGKVLIKIRGEENKEDSSKPSPQKFQAVRRALCNPSHSFIITGGLGGFGLELANWLIRRGARNLVLTGRSGVTTAYQTRLLRFWERSGVQVIVSKRNVGVDGESEKLLAEAAALGPVGGIFHLAMTLRDSLFENQTAETFRISGQAKYVGTKNLDAATRSGCPQLKWFVGFSSISCGRGNAGQANYGWSNSAMERIMEQRRADGHPGMAIQWGAIGDVGVLLNNLGDNSTVVGGTLPQRMPSCLSTLDLFLVWDHPIVSSYVRADVVSKQKASAGAGGAKDIVQTVTNILGVSNAAQINADAQFGDLGLDSLMGVEIKQALERDFELVLAIKEIRTLTLNKLKSLASSGPTAASSKLSSDTGSSSAAASQELSELNPLVDFKLRFTENDLMPTIPIVPLNEPPSSSKSAQNVFFIHSIEGVGSPLQELASRISDANCYCLQCDVNAPADSIEALTAHYIKLMKTVQKDGPYNLVGYSFGAAVAFEMALQLQSSDKAGVRSLALLDGSPSYMLTYRNAYRAIYGVKSEAVFETEALIALAQIFLQFDYKEFRAELLACADWRERTDAVVRRILLCTRIDEARFRFACESLWKKLQAGDSYRPNGSFSGRISLIKARTSAIGEQEIGNDYGLQKITTGNVQVFSVEGDHNTFIQGKSAVEAAGIILAEILRN